MYKDLPVMLLSKRTKYTHDRGLAEPLTMTEYLVKKADVCSKEA